MNQAHLPETVSVVIASYNAASWIRQALDSVLAQTHPILEVVVVDDGSTDRTASIVRSYGGRVTCIPEAHRGRPHRNRGILASAGQFVAFVDADDYWHLTKIEEQLRTLRSRQVRWVICESDWLDSETGTLNRRSGAPIRDGDILEALFLDNFIAASTPLVARRVLDEVGHFDETPDVAPVEDWDLWLRIAARYPVACVGRPLATVRLHHDSFLAATPLADRVASLERVVARAITREPRRLGRLKTRALVNIYHAAGVRMFRLGHLAEARSFFFSAWRQRPTRLVTMGYLLMTFLGARASSAIVSLKRRIARGQRV